MTPHDYETEIGIYVEHHRIMSEDFDVSDSSTIGGRHPGDEYISIALSSVGKWKTPEEAEAFAKAITAVVASHRERHALRCKAESYKTENLNYFQVEIIEHVEVSIKQFQNCDKKNADMQHWKQVFEKWSNAMTKAGIPVTHPTHDEVIAIHSDIIFPMFQADMAEFEQMRLRETVGDFRNCEYSF